MSDERRREFSLEEFLEAVRKEGDVEKAAVALCYPKEAIEAIRRFNENSRPGKLDVESLNAFFLSLGIAADD